MHEPVLMHAYIHERAEIRYISYGTGEFHSDAERGYIHCVGAQYRLRQLVARVASGLGKLGKHIGKGRHADADFSGKSFNSLFFGSGTDIPQFAPANIGIRIPEQKQQLFCRLVTLRVNGGIIQHFIAFGHAEKARTLDISLLTYALNLPKLTS